MSDPRVSSISYATSKVGYTLDRDRQCRALGHAIDGEELCKDIKTLITGPKCRRCKKIIDVSKNTGD